MQIWNLRKPPKGFGLINEGKTAFTIFHRIQDRDNSPFHLPVLKINDYDITRSSSIEFLRVLVDDHLRWTDHINILENKLLNKSIKIFSES